MINWLVVIAYFVATLWLGGRFAGREASLEEYFLAGRSMNWWATSLSIVGTETSTLTFVGVPAIAFGGDLAFLQVAVGYALGRVVVAALLVPAYADGRVQTAYELLSKRFGGAVRRMASSIFIVSRCLADGVRLFATALVLQALLPLPLAVAIAAIMGITLYYTLRGGLRAVIWNDVLQLGVYMGGAVLAGIILIGRIPGGLGGAIDVLGEAGKLRVLDLSWSATVPYTVWGGLIGGAVLTMATHGTDQMFVQRLLACGDRRDAQRAVTASGILVVLQMAVFLGIGSLLYVFYTTYPPAVGFASNDQVFARFIADEMPVGLGGLVIAAVFAAAMSTLSSSLSSLASASTLDFVTHRTGTGGRDSLRVPRRITVLWAVALALVAWLARELNSVLEAGLTITSITFGAILGIFLLGQTRWRLTEVVALAAMVSGLLATVIASATDSVELAWTWFTLLGASVTFLVGALGAIVFRLINRTPSVKGHR